jgi:hypothetical protein
MHEIYTALLNSLKTINIRTGLPQDYLDFKTTDHCHLIYNVVNIFLSDSL